MTEGMAITVPVAISTYEAARLAVLIDPAGGLPDLEAVIYALVDHAIQGVDRPGSWERPWLQQVFGDSWLLRVSEVVKDSSEGGESDG